MRKKKLTTGPAAELAEAVNNAVNAGVEEEIDRMCDPHNQLPEPVADLAWAIEEYAQTKFGTTMNQKLLKRDRIERIEAMCRTVGAGGTFAKFNAENPFNI